MEEEAPKENLAAAVSGSVQHADFTDLVGRWTPDPEYGEIIAAQRRIDWDKWK